MAKLKKYIIIGIIFTSVMGTLSHFLYEWTDRNLIVSLFCPVNESTWEHIKLLYFPMLLYSLFLKWRMKTQFPHIFSAALSGILVGCASIPILFYTYTGILGYNLLWADIAVFLFSVLLAFIWTYNSAVSQSSSSAGTCYYPVRIAALILFVLFLVFTFYPPQIGLFISP